MHLRKRDLGRSPAHGDRATVRLAYNPAGTPTRPQILFLRANIAGADHARPARSRRNLPTIDRRVLDEGALSLHFAGRVAHRRAADGLVRVRAARREQDQAAVPDRKTGAWRRVLRHL